MNLLLQEQAKYHEIWQNNDYCSSNAIRFAELVNTIIQNDWNKKNIAYRSYILEIGCGDGSTMYQLEKNFPHIHGIDITINQVKFCRQSIYQAPAWKIPFPSKIFDYTISTDVMEHIPPEMIEKSISEIFRVTRLKTIHSICTRPAVKDYNGHVTHLTIHPLEWWSEKFARLNKNQIQIKILDADRF